jgi:DNA-binding MarR family transcriptional regulator
MDLEARAHSEHPEALRLWLRLLTCTQLIEKQVRNELRSQFTTTLPRFDLMSQLERSPDGLKMNELSRRMMVTGGNVTGITDQLVTEGLVERINVEGDRRAWRVRLTPRGRKLFNEMAQQHEDWIVEAFAGLSSKEIAQLHKLLGKVKQHSHSQSTGGDRMKHYIGAGNPMRAQFEAKAAYKAEHFAWSYEAASAPSR